jgi:hypothetical protein
MHELTVCLKFTKNQFLRNFFLYNCKNLNSSFVRLYFICGSEKYPDFIYFVFSKNMIDEFNLGSNKSHTQAGFNRCFGSTPVKRAPWYRFLQNFYLISSASPTEYSPFHNPVPELIIVIFKICIPLSFQRNNLPTTSLLWLKTLLECSCFLLTFNLFVSPIFFNIWANWII